MNAAIELTFFRHQPVWEMLAALYLTMIQAGAWAMIVSAAATFFDRDPRQGLRAWGLLAATGLAVAAPLNLIAEMLSPERFYTLFFRFGAASPISWGVAAIGFMALAGLAGCLTLFRPMALPRKPVALAGLASGCAILAYTWFEIARAAGVPLWGHNGATAVLTASGLAAGLGLVVWLDALAGGRSAQCLGVRLTASLASLGSGGALAVWGLLGLWPQTPGWPWGSALLGGACAALLLAGALFLDRPGGRFPGSLTAALVLTWAGALAARLGILLLGQSAALGRAAGEPHLMGHASIQGVFAPLGLFACLMFVAAIALKPADTPAPQPQSSTGDAA